MNSELAVRRVLLTVLLFIAFSCENTTEPDDNKIKIEVALSGAVQKGPFLNGTSVLISELEENLTPTGRNFSSQIENNAGIFQLSSVEYSSQYVELKADGYYYNEISGSASSSPIALYALSDITNRESVNINMLTTLERPRIKQLINNGLTFSAAKDSIYKDILRAFSFPLDSIISPEDLNISAEGEENAKLLAISLILQGNRTEAQLSELISNLSFDLQVDGQINSSSTTTSLFQSVNSLDTTAIRGNLEARFDELGLDATISNFEKYIKTIMQTQNDIVIVFERVISCDGDSLSSINISVLGGEPPYTYQWSNGATSEDIDNIGPGTYSVVVTDTYSQTQTSGDIIIPDRIVLPADVTHIDDQHSEGSIDLIVTGGEAPYTYNWSNGSTNEDILGLGLGIYTVTVTDGNSCQETTSVEIIDRDIVIVANKNVSCLGEPTSSINITVSGGKTPYTYQWSNGAISEDLDNIGPGKYSVVVTDTYSQTQTSGDIIIPDRIVLTADVTHIDDQHSEGSIDLIVTGGEAPYSYNWSIGSSNEDVSGLELGFYTVTVTDINNCEETTTVEIYEATPVIDIDGNLYHVIKIGNQYWLKENLKVTHYRNGDIIPDITDNTEWSNLTTGAYCDSSSVDTYGLLYNWYAVTDSRNIAPEGWHVPTDEEWKELEMTLGMSQSEADQSGWRGTDQGSQLAGDADLWGDCALENNTAFGSSGFAALPGGSRSNSGGFQGMGNYTYFWASTEIGSNHWDRILHYAGARVYRWSPEKQEGFSVRLVRD